MSDFTWSVLEFAIGSMAVNSLLLTVCMAKYLLSEERES